MYKNVDGDILVKEMPIEDDIPKLIVHNNMDYFYVLELNKNIIIPSNFNAVESADWVV